MKILANIPAGWKFFNSLRKIKKERQLVQDARKAGDYEAEREYILNCTKKWGPMIMNEFGATIHTFGEENIPQEGPVVMVGNHQGYADILTYLAVFHNYQFGFVAKEELSKIPFFGNLTTAIRSVFIERDHPRGALKAINEGIENINNGFSMAIFPEGHRSMGKAPREFQRGSLKLATKPGVPIVPVSLHGTYKMYEQDGYFHGADVYIKIHPPIPTAGLSRKEEKELNSLVEKIVVDGVYELAELAGDKLEKPEE